MVSKGSDEGVDVGGNPSAEDGAVAMADPDVEMVVNVIEYYELQAIELSKKDFQSYLMTYCKKVSKHLKVNRPDRLKDFKTKAQEVVPDLVKRHGDFCFFMGKSMDF